MTVKYPDFIGRTVFFEMAVLMGAVGGGVQDYLGYVGLIREKDWGAAGQASDEPGKLSHEPRVVARGLSWLRAPAFDTTISFGSVLLITVCFMILGAAVLHPLRLVPTDADLYSQQSQFLGLIHPQLIVVYKAGVFFAIFGAIYGMLPVYARTTYEISIAIWPKRSWNFDSLRAGHPLQRNRRVMPLDRLQDGGPRGHSRPFAACLGAGSGVWR